MDVRDAVAARRSVRGFLPGSVDVGLVTELARRAARAASGGNLQPWHIDIVANAELDKLKAIMRETLNAGAVEAPEYDIYPPSVKAPYRDRRFGVGEDLYACLGIAREDKPGRLKQFARNYELFGAPAALFVTVDRTMGPPQWSDLGAYITTFMLLAVEEGLATCAQESWSAFPETVRAFLGTPAERMLFCGVAIGYEDPSAPANALRAARADESEWLSVRA